MRVMFKPVFFLDKGLQRSVEGFYHLFQVHVLFGEINIESSVDIGFGFTFYFVEVIDLVGGEIGKIKVAEIGLAEGVLRVLRNISAVGYEVLFILNKGILVFFIFLPIVEIEGAHVVSSESGN